MRLTLVVGVACALGASALPLRAQKRAVIAIPRAATPPLPPSGASRDSSASPPATAARRSDGVQTRVPTTPGWISVQSVVGSRYDTNVNRDTIPVTSVGMVTGLGVQLRAGGEKPWLETQYDVAVHRYTATDRFDRVSQRVRMVGSARLSRRVELGLVAEGALKGSSEDRDVSDQAGVMPRLEVKLGSSRRLRLVGAQRWRRFSASPTQDAVNRYAELELRHRTPDGAELKGEVRVERNEAVSARYDQRRTTFASSYATPISRAHLLELELRYRIQRYPGRLVEVDDVDMPRVDNRFEPSVGWTWRLGTTALALRYEPEHRGSNDADNSFVQHMVTFDISRRW
jgi:hypothetical protein